MLVRDRREQAQDGVPPVTDVPRHLPEGHNMQLPVRGSARTADTARVQGLRSIFRRTSVSCHNFNSGCTRRADEYKGFNYISTRNQHQEDYGFRAYELQVRL